MKNLKLMFVLGGVLGMVACGSSGEGSASSGGNNGNSSGGTTGSGGSSTGSGGHASGGTTASGGAVGTGGHASGGTTGSGGATASGGSASGGSTASGGATATATGGSATGGSATGGTMGSGGATSGGGGHVGSGGAAGAMSSGGGSSGTAGTSGTQHWVGTWAGVPYVDTNSSNAPPISLSNSVLRQVTHVSLGGSQIRVQFSNLDGNGSLVISAAHIARCAATGMLVDSTIDTSTDKALMFSGMASVTIAAGKEAWSDAIDFTIPALGNLTITAALGTVPSTLSQHSGSRTTSYFQSGSTTVNAANMTSAKTAALWFFISAISVMADASAGSIVAIGDSITDGRGTDTDGNDRWTDIVASRMQANPPTASVGMMNAGIGGTNLIGSSGTAAQARFNHDVLGQDGVKYVVVFEGVNDIAGGASAQQLESAYMDLISRAHAKSLKIYGGTITPFGADTSGSPTYYTSAHEMVRQQVNTWIKAAGNFDGFLDFDAAITDGGSPPKIKETYATWSQEDGLHPGPAGYKAMGDAVDLTLFTK